MPLALVALASDLPVRGARRPSPTTEDEEQEGAATRCVASCRDPKRSPWGTTIDRVTIGVVRFHTLAFVLTWAAACGSGPSAPKSCAGGAARARHRPGAADRRRDPRRTAAARSSSASDGTAPARRPRPRADVVLRAARRHAPRPVHHAVPRRLDRDRGHLQGRRARRRVGAPAPRRRDRRARRVRGRPEDRPVDAGEPRAARCSASTSSTPAPASRSAGSTTARCTARSRSRPACRTAPRSGLRRATARVIEVARYINGKLDGPHAVGTRSTLRIEETFAAGVRTGRARSGSSGLLLADETYDRRGKLDGAVHDVAPPKVARVEGPVRVRQAHRRLGVVRLATRTRSARATTSTASATARGSSGCEDKLVFTGSYTAGKPDGEFVYFDRSGNELGRFTITDGTGTMLTFHAQQEAVVAPAPRTRASRTASTRSSPTAARSSSRARTAATRSTARGRSGRPTACSTLEQTLEARQARRRREEVRRRQGRDARRPTTTARRRARTPSTAAASPR